MKCHLCGYEYDEACGRYGCPNCLGEGLEGSMNIVVSYRSVDHFSKRRRFKTLAGARRFAQKYVGETPELGSCYAVSGDGVGRIMVSGATLLELFPALDEKPASAPAERGYDGDYVVDPYGEFYGEMD